MKRQIISVIVAMFVGAMLFGAPAIARKQTLEKRVRTLESKTQGLRHVKGTTVFSCQDGTKFRTTANGFLCVVVTDVP